MLAHRFALGVLLITGSAMLARAQSSYDALVRQGNVELQAGNGTQALGLGQQAIKLDPSRWEAYTLAGGALMNLKRYDEAIDDLSKAIGHAPAAKQTALRDLRKKCFEAENATPQPATPPPPKPVTTQAEIVLWKTIENSQKPEDFNVYLTQYPNGAFVALAQKHLSDMQAVKDKQAQEAKRIAELTLIGLADTKFDAKSSALSATLPTGVAAPDDRARVLVDTYKGQPALGFFVSYFCRVALAYGQVSICHGGTLWVTADDVVYFTDTNKEVLTMTGKSKLIYSVPRSQVVIKKEGGREGDTFSLYDLKGTRFRFGLALWDSQFSIFMRLALSDFAKAYAAILALAPNAPANPTPTAAVTTAEHSNIPTTNRVPHAAPLDPRSDTWTDASTGLMWSKLNYRDADNRKLKTFPEAVEYCSTLRLSQFADWRMPTLLELQKLFTTAIADNLVAIPPGNKTTFSTPALRTATAGSKSGEHMVVIDFQTGPAAISLNDKQRDIDETRACSHYELGFC